MDYLKVYLNLCKRGQLERLNLGYTEVHHVVPRCMGGDNHKNNLTKLTFKEHYLAHKLLTKIYPKHRGVQYAFFCMLRKQPSGKRTLTARMYADIKQTFAKFQKENIKTFNPGKSKKSREAARNRMKTRNPAPSLIDPSKNHTAYPVEVVFLDEKRKVYSCAVEASKLLNIPYPTIKWIRKHKTISKKHNIKEIIPRKDLKSEG